MTGGIGVAGAVAVFAPDPLLTITVEARTDGEDEIHLHPGGQGYWIARMAHALGAPTTLCGPFAGEAGAVVHALVAQAGLMVVDVVAGGRSGAYLHDRRGGERVELAGMRPVPLNRHDLDDLYSATLTAALSAAVVVLAGPGPWDPPLLPPDTYRRLANDLRAAGRRVVADLAHRPLTAALAGGIDVLKISHEELVADGWATGDAERDLIAGMRRLQSAGAATVVLSRAGDPTLALIEAELIEVCGPALEVVDHHGAGDSMTGALAAALARGDSTADAVRLGAAAGALNVTRRGLASGGRAEIARLAAEFEARPAAIGIGP
ncbi:MAG TPA: PfkB family carbohydrate kinase [Sporichthyaceae bacterium]|nr:PfkB family carbohydrate kinase [Sporichthyaceae bacterium]